MNGNNFAFQLRLTNTISFLSDWSVSHPIPWITNDTPEIWINTRRKHIALIILENESNNKSNYFPDQHLLHEVIQTDLNTELPRVINEYINSFAKIRDIKL